MIFYFFALSLLLLGILLGWILGEKKAYQKIKEENKEHSSLFSQQLELIAQELIEQKEKNLIDKTQYSLEKSLAPLNKHLELFYHRMEEIHSSELKNQTALQHQLLQLSSLNQHLSEEAHQLSIALKGKPQQRGAWGELILSRLLELSGLQPGREFELQVVTKERLRPDAIIYLPEDKIIIIDAKVSLIDYQRSFATEDLELKKGALKAHASVIREQIKSLSQKNHPQLFEGKTLSLTLLFIPIEGAFGAALEEDPLLLESAFEKNILLVSPSSLLAALKTIDHFLKAEKQNKNVLEIARLGGVLHDRFVDFSQDLLQVQAQTKKALDLQEQALRRLSSQRGNLISTASKLAALGAKNEKKFSPLLEEFSD